MNLADPLTQVFVGLLLSVPVGVLSGIYSGLIVARLARFEDLRTEMLRIIHAVDYREVGKGTRLHARKELADTLSISSNLYRLGHEAAGDAVNTIRSEIDAASATAPNLQIEVLEKSYLDWQRRCRDMKPSRRAVLRPTIRM